jgi:hypothetical protein
VEVISTAVFTGHPLVGMLVGLGIALVVPKAYRSIWYIRKGVRGERLVGDMLATLPGDYFIFNDVCLPGHGGNIDHIVLGACGVVVLETKHFSGVIKSYGKAWFHNRTPIDSVSKQANRNAIAVRQFLAQRHPDLAHHAVLRFVDSVVVFTDPSARLKVVRAATVIVRYCELLDVIREKASRKRVPPELINRLRATLEHI